LNNPVIQSNAKIKFNKKYLSQSRIVPSTNTKINSLSKSKIDGGAISSNTIERGSSIILKA
jgi:hypothetical protein